MSKSWWWAPSVAVLSLVAATGCQALRENRAAPEKPAPAQPAAPAEKRDETPKPAAPAPEQAKAPAEDTHESLSPDDDRFGRKEGLRATEQKALAQHYYEVGKRLYDEMEYPKAYDNLRLAVENDPTHQAATELYYNCGAILGKRGDELRSNMQQLRQAHQVKVELVRQEMVRFFENGEKAFNAGDFAAAIRDLERARDMIAWYPYQVDTGTPPFRERAEKLIAEAKRKRLQADLQERDRMERVAIDTARKSEQFKITEDQRRVDLLLKQTGDLIQARRFKEAREMAQRTLDLEPDNPFAKKQYDYATQGIHTETMRGIEERKAEEWWQDIQNNEAASQPKEGKYIHFPDDFPERTKDRRAGIRTELFEEPFWIRNYKKILRERKISVNFPAETPLQDVILFLQDITGLNFVIGPGVDATEKRISLRLKDIVIENALKIILEQTKLTYLFEKESIVIVEPGAASGEMEFEIYDISDLLYKIKDFPGHRLSVPNPDAPGGGGAGASLIFDDAAAGQESTINPDTLIEIIKGSTGGDEKWGEGTNIEGHRGQLLVMNTREVHAKVNEVLSNLRQNQGMFVHVETRFVDVFNDFLEDVGVDFRGLGGNPGDERIDPNTGAPRPNTSLPFGTPVDAFDTSGQPGGQFADARYGGTDVGGTRRDFTGGSRVDGAGNVIRAPGPNVEPGVDNFVWRTQNIFGSVLSPVLTGARLAGGAGAILQITQLDHWQTNAILRAEAQNQKVRRLTAPRVTAANREKVYTSVITQRAYIADWELISGGTGLTIVEVADPIIQTFQEGVVLEVRPVISADRKYVTLDVKPTLATLVGGSIRAVIVNLGSSGLVAQQVPIELPEISMEEAYTSVTIPDGGSALLGGFRQVNHSINESSIPIVDSIPVLNFLFKRRGEIKETRSLIVIVTAKIVSIREEEARRFNKQPQ